MTGVQTCALPIYERFLKAVNKASTFIHPVTESAPRQGQEQQKQADDFIFIKSGNRLIKVFPSDILYVEAEGNYMCFHTKGKKIMSLLTAKEVLELLPGDNFVRIHKSFIISLDHIDAIERQDVVVGGKQIPIGITYREHFMSIINK